MIALQNLFCRVVVHICVENGIEAIMWIFFDFIDNFENSEGTN